MIGSHDTFTYLKSVNPIYRLFERWWKCQCTTINIQYAFGIRMFDIRVAWHKGRWYMAHGLANFGSGFRQLTEVCHYMELSCPDAIYRLVLERGSKTDEVKFLQQTYGLCKLYPNLWRIDIKSDKYWLGKYGNNNQALYDRGYKFALVNTWEKPCYELHGSITKDNWWKINLKDEAKRINTNLSFFKDKDKLKQMIESKDELYLIDFCTNEY